MRFFFAQLMVDSPAVFKSAPLARGLLIACCTLGLPLSPVLASSTDGDEAFVAQISEPLESERASTEATDLEIASGQVQDANSLLDALADSQDGQSADVLARQIQGLWNESGSEAVDLLMRRSTLAVRTRNYLLALDLLDTVIALAPEYAEGWNRRATVHFLRDDYALSIVDVEQVLRLEPRHFGALSGIGIILDELGEDRQAQRFLREALRVHPHLSGARQRLDEIDRRLLGAPI